jgi:hypothetical protein
MTTRIRTSGGFPPTPTSFPTASPADAFVLTLWTADAALARVADACGIQRIGVDLERRGKAARQRGLGTWLSPHTPRDLDAMAAVIDRAELFARTNPMHADTPREVETLVAAGVRVLMLPMVATARDAATFVRAVAGRARVVLLVERCEALDALPSLLRVEGVDEVHVGLNDLALSMGLPNRWLTLVGERIADAGAAVVASGRRFGLGGLGRPGDDALPIPADLVYAECVRTGATAALLSRSFHAAGAATFQDDLRRLRERLAFWFDRPAEALAAAHADLEHAARRAAGW